VKVVVSGASGLIGTALVAALREAGDEVVRLTRRPPESPDEVRWDPAAGELDPEALGPVDAAVHLSGAGVGDRRWTAAYKREIRDSRVLSTRTLVTALRALDPLPGVLVSASGVGIYGDRGDEVLTDGSAPGPGFLSGVVRAWEAEARVAEQAGIRVVSMRNGLVAAPHGGAFGRLSTLIKLGVGGPIGNGRQWWPWISLPDQIAATRFLLTHDVHGPVNVSSPAPERNTDLMHALADALHRPAVVKAPAFALRAVLGGFANEILASQRAIPETLVEAGFEFEHPTITEAAAWLAEHR
jgi:uncharacterized protein (TIGR01777 family)